MRKKKNNHLAEGEVTGHFHEAIGKDISVFEEVYGDSSLKLNTPQGSEVVHQEHRTIGISPGIYRTGQVLEYDPAEEEARKVRD